MVAVDAVFDIVYKQKAYAVKSVSTGGNAMLYFVSATDFITLCLHRAKAFNGDRFWTSIPEGRQDEAEIFGPLIANFISAEDKAAFQKPGQYPLNIDQVNAGKICPYCEQSSVFTDSAEIYGTSYGMIYLCRPCQAWTGVHKGTDKALGRLGTKELRELKRQAHHWFDQLLNMGIIAEVYPAFVAGVSYRDKSYMWLAQQLGIKREYCHIGFFDEQQCKRIIEICKPVVQEYLQSH